MSEETTMMTVPWSMDLPVLTCVLDGPLPLRKWLDWMQERSDNWPPISQNARQAGINAASVPPPMEAVGIPANLVDKPISAATLNAIQA